MGEVIWARVGSDVGPDECPRSSVPKCKALAARVRVPKGRVHGDRIKDPLPRAKGPMGKSPSIKMRVLKRMALWASISDPVGKRPCLGYRSNGKIPSPWGRVPMCRDFMCSHFHPNFRLW